MFRLKLLFIILIFVSLNFISAIRINEVELNPLEGSSGIEWVELYNDKDNDIDISYWEIWEGVSGSSGPKKILAIENNTLIPRRGFYIVEFKNKLNNDGDFVILKDSEEIEIDRTPMLKESSKTIKTHQYCGGGWVFEEHTKNSENNCPVEDSSEENGNTNNETQISQTDSEQNNLTTQETQQTSTQIAQPINQKTDNDPITLQTINLNPKNIKSEENSEKLKRNYPLYGLIAFSILLAILFWVRKKGNKNEF